MAAPSGTMRAVQYDRYGGGARGLKHVEVPIPSPKKGEVLIRMEATSINVVDWKFQNGFARPFMPRRFPFISGFDLAGEVVELGAGVSSFKPGDKVIAINFPNGGGLAEYAVASASRTAARPPEVSAVEGVCVPIAAVTALGSLRTAGVTVTLDDPARAPATPKNVLVTAASGAVGHFAVQLARMGGHNVTATCGARNLGLVRSLGADEALDYKTPEGAKLRSPSGRKYDAVVHCAAKGLPWSVFRPVLAASGTVVDITPGFVAVVTAILQVATFSKKRLVPLIVTPKKEEMELLLGMLKQGRLKTVIDSRHPLGSAHEGWAKSMSGHATGKVVIEIGAAQP
ncbi:Chloroplast envelope quinone oxidoreductase [Zea mays]|uniref:Chloroplastic quinone-oxidoreductase n=2 Tax=Zea mays TaxID=4577 RepID=B6TE27_MAIZE|nr:chloroplastic quinone-oxidoreductase [Zea mays]ACG35360.1 chloroplastic quinone-oxidoreductase [Zea mays]ONM34882.1 Chloroplastic quinone-oxidoreductase [Zea mays]PWZ30870.1 Chloroplast envelope quinone oxidoreductase [Zea mays]|eukprot:NP_001149412.1 chloroplastic quinone-oxidoreductase [Zea mays]